MPKMSSVIDSGTMYRHYTTQQTQCNNLKAQSLRNTVTKYTGKMN